MRDRLLKFRGGNGFFLVLAILLVAWFTAKCVWHFDPENSWLNLLLSLEASVTTCMLLDLQFRSTERDRALLQAILSKEITIESAVTEHEVIADP